MNKDKIDYLIEDTGRPLILGLCASLRAGRWGEGTKILAEEIKKLQSETALKSFLQSESEQHLKNFIEAGREQHLPFDKIYINLRKTHGKKGLSNSEVILAAALWETFRMNCNIEILALCDFFPPFSNPKNLDILKDTLQRSDGILLSTPVYFGDRSSLASSFIEMIKKDQGLLNSINGKIYAGLTVGAKRNGGQETALIYQILDMVNANFLAVGNDSDTTSQYGGTCHAGDVGMAWKDEYGLWTSMGTGRRIAKVINLYKNSHSYTLKDRLKIGFFITQDKNDFALKNITQLTNKFSDAIDSKILKLTNEKIFRCIACDICPTSVGKDSEYRCIINKKNDWFKLNHSLLLDLDGLVPVAYTAIDMNEVTSVYQKFIERTRYLRRGDYLFSDLVIAPLTFEEIGADSSLRLRMLTSTIRHHTIISRPIVSYIQEGNILNEGKVEKEFKAFISYVKRFTIGRLVNAQKDSSITKYNPVGYILSQSKDKEDEQMNRRRTTVDHRMNKIRREFNKRIEISCQN